MVKLTKEQKTVQGLLACTNQYLTCEACPYKEEGVDCYPILLLNAFDLVQRQNQEIILLSREVQRVQAEFAKMTQAKKEPPMAEVDKPSDNEEVSQ